MISGALRGSASAVAHSRGAFSGLRRGITLDHVSARYSNTERLALHDIYCRFDYGKVTAITGHSGAGKSTSVALLLRFPDPESGEIRGDGVPLSDIDPELWQKWIAFVKQNTFLFKASVRENIGYGDLNADLAAIEAAARMAQAPELISQLPRGYDTLIATAASGSRKASVNAWRLRARCCGSPMC